MNKTTLVIAHKLATIKDADNIVLVSQGKVVEQGTHAQLLAEDGRYAALVRAQDLGDEKEERKAHGPQQTTSPGEIIEEDSSLHYESTNQQSVDESMNRSLLTCLTILFGEQKALWRWFMLAVPAAFIAGGAYPAQALLFSRLINVFILPRDQARDRADFFSLMFFIVAIATAIGYFIIGWTCNLVRFLPSLLAQKIDADM